jgi:selenocysteine-specific elongation factor
MKHVIIGTAGHIDHGKTTLVKTLTGRDTDTLKEEKERGISIDLGFTFFNLPSGKRCGIVDVPGHERFIKNMLAGVSGIDLVLLVIAAEEGIMPQTREHFEILQLLSVKKGIIVITKVDLVDEDILMLVEEDIKEFFKGTFLDNAPIVAVSVKTADGVNRLIDEIDKAVEEIDVKDKQGLFRLPVDRVFSVSGFGTVVTGTVVSGKVSVGENLQLYPSGKLTRVRGIQVHDKEVQSAEAGERCALNLSAIKVEEVQRGNVIALPDKLYSSNIMDCSLSYLKSAEKPLENRQKVRIYHGTEELLGRVVLLDKEELKPGDKGFIQILLEKPITALAGDRFVLRSYSPMITIGGGEIIIASSKKKKRFQSEVIKDLQERSEGKNENLIEKCIENLSSSFPDIGILVKTLGKTEEVISLEIEKLCKKSVILIVKITGKEHYIHSNFIGELISPIVNLLSEFHSINPLKQGINKEELKSRVFCTNIKQKYFDAILNILQERKLIKVKGSFVSHYDFQIVFDRKTSELAERIIEKYKSTGFSTQKYEELVSKERDSIAVNRVFKALLENGELIKLSEGIIIHKEVFEKSRDEVKEFAFKNDSISVGEARDLLQISRKYAIALLEYLDQEKITRRVEDKRILY